MNFPITKEQLQKGFELKNNININEKKLFIEQYIKDILEMVSIQIIKKTVDEYTYINNNNFNINEIQKFKFDLNFGNINGIFRNEMNNFWNKNYDYNYNIYNCNTHIPIFYPILEDEITDIKMKILEGLKERFPDCSIEIDSLQTYILIDWN